MKLQSRFFSVTTTFQPTARTDLMSAIKALYGYVDFGAITRLKLKTTAAGVSGSPFENRTPFRMKNVYVRPWFETAHRVARTGATPPFGVSCARCWYTL